MIELTIDGKALSAPKGTSILKAALNHGIYIPHLCYDPRLERHGGCRMCLVELEGQPRLFASCSTPIDNGMKVLTHTQQVNKLRQTMLELMLANHPLECSICDKAGECTLQDLAYKYGSTKGRFKSPRNSAPQHENPLIDTNTNRCILCGKCVRICWEQQGVGALNFQHRGATTIVSTAFNETLNCEFCGQCMDVCPVGALTPRPSKHRSRVWFMETRHAVCPFCSVGCTLDLDIHDQTIIRSRGRYLHGINKGNLCAKGRYGYDFIYTDDRLTTPLIRREGVLQRASWEEALGQITDSLSWIKEKKGAKRIGAISSPRFSNEDNYMLQKFMRQVIGSHNIDSIAHFGFSKMQEAIEEVFGITSLPVDQAAPLGAGVVMVVESEIDATHPVWSLNFIRAKHQGTKLVVVHPRRTKLAVHADQWLAVNPGTSEVLLKGIIHLALEQGMHTKKDSPLISGFNELAASVGPFTPSYVASLTGLSEEEVRDAAVLFLGASPRVIAMTLGANENEKGKNTVLTASNLLMLTGDGPRGLQMPSEYNNSFGMWKMGAAPGHLPRFEKLTPGGKNAYQMLYEPDRINALFVMGEDPVVNFPDASRVKQIMSTLDFVVVLDIRLTETAKLAQVVLPAATWVETDGTFVNAADISQMTRKILTPPGEARPAWQALNELTCFFDQGVGKNDLHSLRKEMTRIEVDAYADLPRFVRTVYSQFETTDDEYPLVMIAVSLMQHSGTLSLISQNLRKVKPEGFIEINEKDATRYHIPNNRFVTVTSRRGSMVIKAHITGDVKPGVVCAPVHFSLANVNNLIGIAHDGAAPLCAVRIEPISERR
ncbi:MAG: molybdopterin-dependent oxidoreductase [Thermodesulfovibrionales bacterium]